eukprot:7085351-Pyramimonas_sp.AAC.1
MRGAGRRGPDLRGGQRWGLDGGRAGGASDSHGVAAHRRARAAGDAQARINMLRHRAWVPSGIVGGPRRRRDCWGWVSCVSDDAEESLT